jgi:uncharacterized protein YecE (DUF72 family)
VRSKASTLRALLLMKGSPRWRVGCSGWNYKSWKGPFYPSGLAASKWLPYYAERFDTVEINNTFYRLPEAETFANWRSQVPAGFLFAVKASRFLTHMKRLRDPEEPIERLFSRAHALGPCLGPVLYQLPGNLQVDLPLLNAFLGALPRGIQHVVEFRHPSWYGEATFDYLERYGASLCLHDKEGSEITEPFVGRCAYVRFHGTSGRYHGSYSDRTLAGWAKRLEARWRDGMDVYAYFNNDPDAVATQNAATLLRFSATAGVLAAAR